MVGGGGGPPLVVGLARRGKSKPGRANRLRPGARKSKGDSLPSSRGERSALVCVADIPDRASTPLSAVDLRSHSRPHTSVFEARLSGAYFVGASANREG